MSAARTDLRRHDRRGVPDMRGPLWRGWLWTPRIWWARLFRGGQTTFGADLHDYQRRHVVRFPTRARWWHYPWLWLVLFVVAALTVAVLTLTQLVFPLVHLLFYHLGLDPPLGRLGWLPHPCGGNPPGQTGDSPGRSCATITSFLTPVTGAALAFFVFYLFTRTHVRRWYRKRAQDRPCDLVRTASDDIDRVVGREELCEVLIERVRDGRLRCPTVIVGGVGSGKTATLVALTRELARRGIVPVPIRLHDVQDKKDIDFEKMARERFLAEIDARLTSDSQGTRLWRTLRWSNHVVVLADGLEEAVQADKEHSGESVIRTAVARAADTHLPLVIASRPYDPLRGMPAIVVGLEPLGEGAALEYALGGDDRPGSVTWAPVIDLVLAADVTESPVFLRIIRDLNRQGRLRPRAGYQTQRGVAAQATDRYAVRWQLLEDWREALQTGLLRADVASSASQREGTLRVLAAFACVGFLRDSLQVGYAALTDEGRWERADHPHRPILDALVRGLPDGRDPRDRDVLNHAATEGSELGVVDAQSDGVRFHHGDIQAYLGAWMLTEPQVRDALLPHLLNAGPSRELLDALRLLSRHLAEVRENPPDARSGRGWTVLSSLREVWESNRRRPGDAADLTRRLRTLATNQLARCWELEFSAAALEIDVSSTRPDHAALVHEVAGRWHRYQDDTPDRPVDEAKLDLVRRIGETGRLITDRRRFPAVDCREALRAPPYADLFRMAGQERSYRVRLAAARELGLGGTDAALALTGPDLLRPRVEAVESGDDDGRQRREQQMRGWVVPLLHLSTVLDMGSTQPEDVRRQHSGTALHQWLTSLPGPDRGDDTLTLSAEMALAQGFRLAANMRRLPVGRQQWDRSFLAEKAEYALRHSRFWYSHLTLIQALTLLSLPDDPATPLPRRGRGANPSALVQHWVAIAGAAVPGRDRCTAHPFVLEVGRLCVLALLTRRPERFCWVDERETASRVGSCTASPVLRHEQRLWIPDSMGWSILGRRAQRLLADVMLLLNLADRGESTAEREARLARADRCDLPPCLTNDRSALQPLRTVRGDQRCDPGATCLDDCAFRLCPLPARGERLPHDLDQNFCARQRDLATLRYVTQARAPWQNSQRRSLRRFWQQMSERTLPGWRR
ncbi:ATP-binding protein [Micromonospora robiginosa]|uniref:ATP-binding protein n=1 Tax=Micromonospora robiginosa TaxID=2749844 RepID=A0A7L6B379_9ACTN|nr:ATP-binding protein [Micromonospora ferruginea]QLQ36235.1 ATP-binding protein [Micromonospora ferruginea]